MLTKAGEYQPVYEEFGYILLLVLCIIYRFNLSVRDLGNTSDDRFVPQMLKRCGKEYSLEDLKNADDKHAQLGGWIKALYDGEGISDELMQSCRPQDFFLLVPTLFYQSVEACDRNILDMDTLKGGLECKFIEKITYGFTC